MEHVDKALESSKIWQDRPQRDGNLHNVLRNLTSLHVRRSMEDYPYERNPTMFFWINITTTQTSIHCLCSNTQTLDLDIVVNVPIGYHSPDFLGTTHLFRGSIEQIMKRNSNSHGRLKKKPGSCLRWETQCAHHIAAAFGLNNFTRPCNHTPPSFLARQLNLISWFS